MERETEPTCPDCNTHASKSSIIGEKDLRVKIFDNSINLLTWKKGILYYCGNCRDYWVETNI